MKKEMKKKDKLTPQPKPQKSGLFGSKPKQPKPDDCKELMSYEEIMWFDEFLVDE